MRKQKFLLILLCMCLSIPIKTNAQDYDIEDYHYIASILKNHTIEIQEQYQIYVYQPSCVFERNLVYLQEGKQRNGEKFSRKNRILNISTTSSSPIVYSKNNEKTIVVHPIIDEDNLGMVQFTYQRDLGKIIRDENDELFFYIVDGTSREMISNIHFTIHLPIPVTEQSIRFYLNGSDTNRVSYHMEGNTIIGTLNTALGENQTLSISVLFPKGYFVGNQSDIILYCGILLLPVLCLFYAIFIWIRYVRHNKVIVEEMIIPPNQFDPAELSFLLNGYTTKRDIISLLLVLANQGYLRIIHQDNLYAIEKIKSYDGKNALQKTMFDDLFHESNIVSEIELREYLNDHEKTLKAIIDNKDHQKHIFEFKYKKISILSKFLLLLGCIGSIGIPIYYSVQLPILSLILTIFLFFGIVFSIVCKSKLIVKLLGIIVFFFIVAISGYYLSTELILWITHMVGIVLLCISAAIFHKLSKRTRYGNEILGKIIGFRKSLYSMRVPILREQMEENSTYFYEMLSYAYVFGFYDKWLMGGYQIISNLPVWYLDYQCGSLKTLRKSLSTFLWKLEMNESNL